MKNFYFLPFICLISIFCTAQNVPFEYMGVIKLNDSAFISYKLVFEEMDGTINGYSISDLGGPYETKSNIRGSYDQDTQDFSFNEYDIVYTKSPVDNFDMCLVHFSSSVRKLKTNKMFDGKFEGKYIDSKPCLSGDLFMTSIEIAQARAEKIDKKLQKSKRVSAEIKDKFSAGATVDTLIQSSIKKGENLNIFTKSKEVIFSIYDSGKVDNDRINLYINDKLVLENFSLTAKKQKIILTTIKDATVRVRIEAINEGLSSPNTVKIEILDNDNLISTRTILNTSEDAFITFINKI